MGESRALTSPGRFVAFLRGITPMNARMSELKAAFEDAGFGDVRTVLSSGNVVFSTRSKDAAALERKAEAAMQKSLGRTFFTLVRSVDELQVLLESDPFAAFELAPDAKRVVTFLRDAPKAKVKLPIELDGARILENGGPRDLHRLRADPQGPRLHEPHQEELRRGPDDPHLGHPSQGHALTRALATPDALSSRKRPLQHAKSAPASRKRAP